MKKPQKSILFSCILLFFALNICGQKNHFIYIQTENKQPFQVKLGDHLYGPSDAGYLIIPRLTEGAHDLSIGFPKNEWPQQNVTCIIKESDAGYLLKNSGDRGWGLTNLQTMQVLMAKKEVITDIDVSYEIATDSFSLILASVVNDRGILKRQKNLVDTALLSTNANKPTGRPLITEEVKGGLADVKKEAPVSHKPTVVRLKQDSIPGGLNITFMDASGNKTDTVQVFIPVANDMIDEPGSRKDTLRSGNKKISDIELPDPHLRTDTAVIVTDTAALKESKPASQNAPCRKTATNKDIIGLRKQMTATQKENDMVIVALKKFRTICFSTGQIKELGSLFLSDEGKYKLYVAAYPFVSDLPEFNSLESQLKDEYYISRFRAMIR